MTGPLFEDRKNLGGGLTQGKEAWNADTYGYGKHDYRHIDPDTVNPEEYARNLRGEEEHFGDVREYNSASNDKNQDNNVTLDDLARVGTVIDTEAKGFEGHWMVVQMPRVESPLTFARMARVDAKGEPVEGTLTDVPMVALGCVVNAENRFEDVISRLLERGKVDRTQRERLTKRG